MLDPQSQRVHRASSIRRLLVLAVVVLMAAFCWRGTPVSKLVKRTRQAQTLPLVQAKAPRKVYPFSIIYGGAYSGEELARARKLDGVVARHYAGFGSFPTIQRMPNDAFMYVSYRKSDQVFWTKTKRRIPQGETVLTDGVTMARTRCGNRLSPKPQAPVASGPEPTDEALDVPDKPKPSLATANPVPSASDANFFVPANPADVVASLSPSGPDSPVAAKSGAPSGESETPYAFGGSRGGAGPFLGSNLFYPNSTGSSVGSSGGSTIVPPGAPIYPPEIGLVTPEPGTLPLLLVGVLLGSPTLIRRWRTGANASRPNS